MEPATMGNTEYSRLEIIHSIIDKRISVTEAERQLGLSRCQVHQLLSRYKTDGAAGLVSGKPGKPSNRRYSDVLREHVLHIGQARYHVFAPTLPAKKRQQSTAC